MFIHPAVRKYGFVWVSALMLGAGTCKTVGAQTAQEGQEHASKPARPQPTSAPPITANKPAPPSVSNPTPGKDTPAKTKPLYPVSAEETADAILADSLERIFLLADRHYHAGEYNHMINLNYIVAQGDPHNVETYGNAALLLWSTDRGEQAIDFLKQGIQANPNTYYVYDDLAAHYWLHLKNPQAAIPYYEQATAFKCPWFTWHSLALCYEKTKQWDKAVQAWEKAARYTDDQLAPGRLERARKERDRQDKDKAKSDSGAPR